MAREDLVFIAGAGPVGLAAAVELTRRGVPVRIADRDAGPTPADQSRALGVLPQTLRILEASGLSEKLLAAGTTVGGADLSIGEKKVVSLDLSGARTPYPFILSLPQGKTERLMIEWLGARNVAVEWNVPVEAVGDTRRPTVRLGTGEEVAATAVLGCDGGHSKVREEIGVPWVGEGYPGIFALADVAFSVPIDPHRARFSLGSPAGTSHALVPMSDRTGRLIGFHDSPERLVAAAKNVERVIWQSTFHVAFRRAERMSRGWVFLAGDAAHVHSPVGGRGMNLGIWDVATFAWLFSEHRETEYESKRLPVVKTVLDQTFAGTQTLDDPPAYLGPLLRYVMPLATGVPFVGRRIAERLLALDLPQPEWL
ncbi:FAD-dependent oxidoreductase [Jiella sonneratiae]|uniref:FAD-dependent monooxygenase n=1 Tax=Jiella sonneratiae TaxID=2816856 RepID=A0ABS3IY30_9HYPH|nr:FAD-dependent monooxygenase [Jiella sonneratiae]MBO0902307.1 FAD-dependent monooxygenase [Jiella sonneratiae]